MAGMSDDDGDSRTASIGQARVQSKSSSPTSQLAANDTNGRKKSQTTDKTAKRDLQDFVPGGGKFSTTPLAVDPEDSTSSSGSYSSNHNNEPEQNMNKRRKPNAPAISWNQASRSSIRTSLGARSALAAVKNQQTKSAFDAVNDKYFRSRSASASAEEEHEDNDVNEETKPIGHNPNAREETKTYFVDDSDNSESGEVSEGGDSMMLNIGQQGDRHGLNGSPDDGVGASTFPFILDTSPNLNSVPLHVSTDLDQQRGRSDIEENGSVLSDPSVTQLPPQSKDEAFAEFAAIYTTSPAILADLKVKDLEIQARFFFYNSSIHELDLTKPISCTECLQEGHLAFVCPSKEVCRLASKEIR